MSLPDGSFPTSSKTSLSIARELFEMWAPAESLWSGWAKPALFVYPRPAAPAAPAATAPTAAMVPPAPTVPTPAPSWQSSSSLPIGSGRKAIVVDLPGVEGIHCGLALAERGFRPVPLYNLTQGQGEELIPLDPLIEALHVGAARLRDLTIPDDAPPAFLLDADRASSLPRPSMFDNRWMVFPQDLPSARALLSAGIERVTLIRRERGPRADLLAVFRLWKREGLPSDLLDPAAGQAIDIELDTSLGAVFRAHLGMVFHGLRENAAGGFGGVVPVPQATSGGFG
jgi:hypothetical protein